MAGAKWVFGAKELEDSDVGTHFAVEDTDNVATDLWRRSILHKKLRNKWELLSEDGFNIIETHKGTGEGGVYEEFGMFYRMPEVLTIQAAEQEAAAAAAEVEESTGRDTTPRRKRLREAAAQQQTKQARGVQKRAAQSDGGLLKVGAVVQVAVDDHDD